MCRLRPTISVDKSFNTGGVNLERVFAGFDGFNYRFRLPEPIIQEGVNDRIMLNKAWQGIFLLKKWDAVRLVVIPVLGMSSSLPTKCNPVWLKGIAWSMINSCMMNKDKG